MLQSSLKFITHLCLVVLFLVGCGNPDSSKHEGGVETEPEVVSETPQVQKKILFFGNSLTAGYGVEPEQAFPNLIQQRLDSMGLPYRVINAGLSGETTASGANRIDWVLREPVAIMILELGGNDGLRGIDPAETKKNLQQIISLARNKYSDIQIIVAGMEAPPNMGSEYITAFRNVFSSLAEANSLPLIPFLLEGVGGEPELNLPDGIHPNPEGHKIVADNVWEVLEELLSENAIDQ